MSDLDKVFEILGGAGRLPGQRKSDGSWPLEPPLEPDEKCLRCGATDGEFVRLTNGVIVELIHPECAIAQLEGAPLGVRPSPLVDDNC